MNDARCFVMKGSIAAVLLMGLLLFGCTGNSGNSGYSAPNGGIASASGASGGPGGQNLIGTKFSDWKYYPMAMQIAPGQVNASAQAALNVFSVQQTQQQDGSLLVAVADNQDGGTYNFTLSGSQTLYFSDGNPGDDLANTSDGALFDDHFVVVDSNGDIVQAVTAP